MVEYKMCHVVGHCGSVPHMEKGFAVGGGLQNMLCSRALR
jgi:hypothetical protein